MAKNVAAQVLEIISLICITVTLVPQIVLNYRLQNTKGLSTISVLLWILSGQVSSVYLIWTNQLVIISIAYAIFVSMAVFISCQIVYYSQEAPVPSPGKSNFMNLFLKRYLIFVRNFGVSLAIALMTGLGIYFLFELSKSYGWIPKVLGSIIPVIVDSISFIPQVILIIKKKSAAGYSLLFILTEVTGSICGIISICVGGEIDVTPLISFGSITTYQLIILVLKVCVFRSEKDKNGKIWPVCQSDKRDKDEELSTSCINEKQLKKRGEGLVYIPPPSNRTTCDPKENGQGLEEWNLDGDNVATESCFPINGTLKTLFQKEMQAYYVDRSDTDESIVRMFAQQMTNDDPFFIADVSHCAKQYLRWSHYLPRVKPFYAVKTNPNTSIIKIIGKMGGGFDCASMEELITVLSVFPDLDCSTRVIYANPCKQISHMKYFKERGVQMTVADNEVELMKIKEHWPTAKVLIRLKTNDSHAVIALSSKYGATEKVAVQLFALAKKIDVAIVGCAFHVGSGCYNQDVFTRSIELAKKLFDIGNGPEYDFKMNILNIGGGFPGTEEKGKPGFISMTKTINEALTQFFPEEQGVQCMAEPGRYFAAAYMNLVTSVIGYRRNNQDYIDRDSPVNPNSLGKSKSVPSVEYVYYINDGIYGSLSNITYEEATYVVTCFRKKANASNTTPETLHSSAVFGPTCDSTDRLSPSVDLPALDIGDYIYIYDVGAYSNSVSTSFNGFKTSKYFYIYKD